MVRHMGVEERRARLAVRHRLAGGAKASRAVQVATDMVALHGTDPASVYLAVSARMSDPDIGAIERALYDDRSLVRMLGMRRTMFVVPVDLAPVVQAACAQAVAVQERRKLVQHLEQAGVADAANWLVDVEESTAHALMRRGEAVAAELAEDEPRLRTALLMAQGKPYASRQNITTRVLTLLAAEARIVRGRPRGSWISSQYRWLPMEKWLSGGMADVPVSEARVDLVRRWLAAYGPGTLTDLKWWTGWRAGEVKKALAQVDPAEVELDAGTGFVLTDDLDSTTAEPWAALLPALDPTVMGWSERGWFLGDHAAALFDRSGNVGPTVWWDGRIVGGWAQRGDGQIAFRLLEDVGTGATRAVAAEAERLGSWLGEVRVTPRFRTPLEKELAA